jgi:hypothetical protein
MFKIFTLGVQTLILVLSIFIFNSWPAEAQTPASPSSQQIRDAVQKKVQESLANIKQAVARKAFVGNISSKTETDFVITNLKNQTRTVTVTGETVIKLLNGKEGTIADLKNNDFVLSIGDVDSQNKMAGKRILVLKQPDPDNREVMFATVTKASTSSITVENSTKESWTIKLSSSTAVTNITSDKVATARTTNLKVGDKVVLVGTTATGQNTLTGRAVHILP